MKNSKTYTFTLNDDYNFHNYKNVIQNYLSLLAYNGGQHMLKQYKTGSLKYQSSSNDGKLAEQNENLYSILNFTKKLEDFLYHIYKKFPNKTFEKTLSTIQTSIKQLDVLPTHLRGIYGETVFSEYLIHMNPNFFSSMTLSGDERTRLYIAHEFGHVIHRPWMLHAFTHLNTEFQAGHLSKEDAELIYDGFSLLDEAITQNRAENFAYEFSNKHRPTLTPHSNSLLFNGQSFNTNFDYYGELQEPAILFARTLRGIGNIKDDEKALNELSTRAMSPDFVKSIFEEYERDGHKEDLLQELKYMGHIKRASYAKFGYDDKKELETSKENLTKFQSLANSLRDLRENSTNSSKSNSNDIVEEILDLFSQLSPAAKVELYAKQYGIGEEGKKVLMLFESLSQEGKSNAFEQMTEHNKSKKQKKENR